MESLVFECTLNLRRLVHFFWMIHTYHFNHYLDNFYWSSYFLCFEISFSFSWGPSVSVSNRAVFNIFEHSILKGSIMILQTTISASYQEYPKIVFCFFSSFLDFFFFFWIFSWFKIYEVFVYPTDGGNTKQSKNFADESYHGEALSDFKAFPCCYFLL